MNAKTNTLTAFTLLGYQCKRRTTSARGLGRSASLKLETAPWDVPFPAADS